MFFIFVAGCLLFFLDLGQNCPKGDATVNSYYEYAISRYKLVLLLNHFLFMLDFLPVRIFFLQLCPTFCNYLRLYVRHCVLFLTPSIAVNQLSKQDLTTNVIVTLNRIRTVLSLF